MGEQKMKTAGRWDIERKEKIWIYSNYEEKKSNPERKQIRLYLVFIKD
jgi:hypothetical protein